MAALRRAGDAVNSAFEQSMFGRFFKVQQRKSSLLNELRAGTVTFLTGPLKGQFECRFDGPDGTNPGYKACTDEVRKNLVTATAASSLIACAIMGVAANMPLALAPGMGLNAYFTYNVVGYYGTGNVSYQEALAAIFIEGWIFIILSLTGVRQGLIRLLPETLARSMSAGIGLFLAFIGYQASEGIGVVGGNGATLVSLGGCSIDDRIYPYYISDTSTVCTPAQPGGTLPNLPPAGTAYECLTNKMHSAPMWLGLGGLAIMTILMARNVRAAIIIGISITTIIAWLPGHGASYLGSTSNIPGGIGDTGPARWAYFKKVVAVPSLSKTGAALSFSNFNSGSLWIALVTFLYVDFFDATGTLFAMANFVNNFIPGFVDEKNNFPGSVAAYCSDGAGIVIGSLMGTSPVTVFVESATGIRSGGRTGLTALMVSFWFFVALWFTPIIASIPVYCTGPALILTGALMMVNITKIDWNDVNKAVPAFITISIMVVFNSLFWPLTYSIAYGVIGGVIAFVIAHVAKLVLEWVAAKTGCCTGANSPPVELAEDFHVTPKAKAKVPATAVPVQDSAHGGVEMANGGHKV
ncbi:g6984 [Coccomyxa elongata]